MKMRLDRMLKIIKRITCSFCRDQRGQTAAEYGLLIWFSVFVGTVTLVTFIFAFEQAIIGYYEDIVNVVVLPLP